MNANNVYTVQLADMDHDGDLDINRRIQRGTTQGLVEQRAGSFPTSTNVNTTACGTAYATVRGRGQ